MSPMSNVAISTIATTTTAKVTTGTTSTSTTAKVTTGTTSTTTTSTTTTAKATTGTTSTSSSTSSSTSTTGSIPGIHYINPGDNFTAIIAALLPGETAIFRAGTYYLTSKFSTTLNGDYGNPITIKGDDGAIVKLVRNNTLQNIWDLSGTFLNIQNLEFQGGSRGLRFGETQDCSYITVQNCKIHNTDSHAVTFNQDTRTYTQITFLNNQIYDLGTFHYLHR